MGMRSAKKKPMTKKEREEKKTQRETLKEVKARAYTMHADMMGFRDFGFLIFIFL